MIFDTRELWTVLHGMILGSLYLLAFAGGAEALWSFRPEWMTEAGVVSRMRRLMIGVWTMTLTCWLAVISGTYVVYVWYRENIPTSPKSKLMADVGKAFWHTFAMEWKEHVSWLAAILSTTVAFLVTYYGREILVRQDIRRVAFCLLTLAFVAAAIGGLFGAFINKAAPMMFY